MEPPRPARLERPFLSPEELGRLLEGVRGDWLYLPALLAGVAGLRRGEVLALRWADVDFRAGTLIVRQTLGADGRFAEPKSRESRREITLPAFLLAELQRHKAAQAEHRLQVGDAWTDRGFVVADGLGNPRSPGSLTHAFAELTARAGLPKITFHDLRHVNATLLLLAGVPDKVASERLGHCDTQITRDLYQYVLPRMDEEAARKTDDFFRRALGG
ncbi:MAG: site-specific integrase [Armatimonadetes bacterium]|nr:site-specific integrase [Armatimonadota bacterium]